MMAVRADRTWLVALGASLWGLSALWRDPLAQQYESLAIVFWEHIVLVLIVSPWLIGSVRAVARASLRTQLSVLVIGAGSSALATVLFTMAFQVGDPITPQVLQKLQPIIAILLAAVILGERLRAAYLWFIVPAVTGAWLLSFPDPLSVGVSSLHAAALAVGAAALWAAGTVLGRYVSQELGFRQITVLRFAVGLVAVTVLSFVTSTPLAVTPNWSTASNLVLLALVPGLAALLLYYRGLSRTPASRATLAELAFPVMAAFVGVTILDGRLDASQWIGFGIVLSSIVALSVHERQREHPAVLEPDPALR